MSTIDPTPYTPTDEDRLVDDISSIIKRGRYNRSGPGRPSDNPLDRRDARQIVNYLAARDARVRAEALRDAAQAFNVEAVYFSSHDRSLSQGQQAAAVDVLAESLNWLHTRAASIEQETQPRASCGCDLTGMTPPAVHIVDRHGETQP